MIKQWVDSNEDWYVNSSTSKALLVNEPTIETKTGVTLPQTFTAIAAPVVSFKRYGKITQAATPTPSNPSPLMCNAGEILTTMFESIIPAEVEQNDEIIPAVYTPEVITLNGVTANIPPLFATAGGLKDELDMLTGFVTRQVTVLFLNGSESSWDVVSGSGCLSLETDTALHGELVWCTHFGTCASSKTTSQMPNNTVKTHNTSDRYIYFKHPDYLNDKNGWVTWLEEQYDAGTPVTLVYRRKTPRVFAYIDKQAWTTASGSNTISNTSQISGQTADISYITG